MASPPDTLRARARVALMRFLRWLLTLRGSPESIALGFAIGTFVAFTPTIGFQTLIALGLATLLGANRPAAVIGPVVTNPATIPPIYAFTYWLGSLVWDGPPVGAVRADLVEAVERLTSYGWSEMDEQLRVFAAIGRDILVPLWIGGIALGLVAGAATYFPALRLVEVARRRFALRGRFARLRDRVRIRRKKS